MSRVGGGGLFWFGGTNLTCDFYGDDSACLRDRVKERKR